MPQSSGSKIHWMVLGDGHPLLKSNYRIDETLIFFNDNSFMFFLHISQT